MVRKSATKAAAAPVAVVQPVKKGKRDASETINKVVSAKKQKVEKDQTLEAKKKLEKKVQPKKAESKIPEVHPAEPEDEPEVAPKSVPAAVPEKVVEEAVVDASEGSESEEEAKDAATTNGDEDGSENGSDEELAEAEEAPVTEIASPESDVSDEKNEEENEEESEEESEEEQPAKPVKKDTKMVEADVGKKASKTPATPATPQITASKTLFAGNLAFRVEETDVRDFFKGIGEVVEVRFATDPEGKFKGFGHIEFATPEDAQKALDEKNGKELLERPVKLDMARERGAYTPGGRDEQKGGRVQSGAGGTTAFIKGFDTSLGEEEIRNALKEHFGSCGTITRLSIPPNSETGGVKGMAYIDFEEADGFNKAMELDGTDVGGGYHLTVNEAKPRGDSGGGRGGRGGGGRGGGRFGGGGRGGGGGRRGGGGRFGGGGRGGGGRGRGRSSRF